MPSSSDSLRQMLSAQNVSASSPTLEAAVVAPSATVNISSEPQAREQFKEILDQLNALQSQSDATWHSDLAITTSNQTYSGSFDYQGTELLLSVGQSTAVKLKATVITPQKVEHFLNALVVQAQVSQGKIDLTRTLRSFKTPNAQGELSEQDKNFNQALVGALKKVFSGDSQRFLAQGQLSKIQRMTQLTIPPLQAEPAPALMGGEPPIESSFSESDTSSPAPAPAPATVVQGIEDDTSVSGAGSGASWSDSTSPSVGS